MLRLASVCLLLSACSDFTGGDVGRYDDVADWGAARLSGTVVDTPFADDATVLYYTDGYSGELMISTDDDDGLMGMLLVWVEGRDLAEVFEEPGTKTYSHSELTSSLCGDIDGEGYDELADETIVTVVENEDGARDVLLRGSMRNGERFQLGEFTLAADSFRPVVAD